MTTEIALTEQEKENRAGEANLFAVFMTAVGHIDLADRPRYMELQPSDHVVSRDKPPSLLILRLAARLHDVDAAISAVRTKQLACNDGHLFQPLLRELSLLNTEFNFLMYTYLGIIEREFPDSDYPSGFYSMRGKKTIVITQEAMDWIGKAALDPPDYAEIYAFQRKIVISPLAGD